MHRATTLDRVHPCFALFALIACVPPPPPETAAESSAAAAPAEESSGSGGAPKPAANVPAGSKLMAWDGDETGTGAKGWQDCDKKPDCKATLEPAAGIGRDGSVGLKFHGEGSGWIGFGWNWFNWFPADAGVDASPYSHFVFLMKIDAKTKEEAPDPGSIQASIKCSSDKDKGQSRDAPVAKHSDGDILDGKWHQIAVPMDALKKDKFDPKTAWEFVLGTWSGVPRNFDIVFDDIGFEKR